MFTQMETDIHTAAAALAQSAAQALASAARFTTPGSNVVIMTSAADAAKLALRMAEKMSAGAPKQKIRRACNDCLAALETARQPGANHLAQIAKALDTAATAASEAETIALIANLTAAAGAAGAACKALEAAARHLDVHTVIADCRAAARKASAAGLSRS